MGKRGANSGLSNHNKSWKGVARKRCQYPKCKKRARHSFKGKVFCKKHFGLDFEDV